jgi:hypothetical protein
VTTLPEPIEQEEDLSPILARLSKDLKAAATALTEGEARFLVDYYYTAQRNRIRAGNQVRQSEGEEPNGVIRYFFSGEELFESRIKAALNI